MTWKELKELIEQMSPEEQETSIMIWSEYDIPRPVQHFRKIGRNIYTVDNGDYYCDDKYVEDYPEENAKLVLKEGEYCLKS